MKLKMAECSTRIFCSGIKLHHPKSFLKLPQRKKKTKKLPQSLNSVWNQQFICRYTVLVITQTSLRSTWSSSSFFRENDLVKTLKTLGRYTPFKLLQRPDQILTWSSSNEPAPSMSSGLERLTAVKKYLLFVLANT